MVLRPRRLAAYLYVLALFGYLGLAPLAQIVAPDSSIFSVALRGTTLFGVILLPFILKPERVSHLMLALAPILLLLVLFGIRLFENIYLRGLDVYVDGMTVFLVLFGSCLLPFLIFSVYATRIDTSAFVLAMNVLLLAFLCGLVFNIDALTERATADARLGLDKLNPISIANISFVFMLYFFVFRPHVSSVRVLSYIALPALLVVAALSMSRGPLIATALTLLIYLVTARANYRVQLLWVMGLLIFVVWVLHAYFSIDLLGVMLKRFSGGDLSESVSANMRIMQWHSAWHQFLEHPVVGDLVYEKVFHFYPHNIVLEALMSLGLIGGFLVVVGIGIGIKCSIKVLSNRRSVPIATFSALIMWMALFQAMLSGSIWSSSSFWISMGVTTAFALEKRSR